MTDEQPVTIPRERARAILRILGLADQDVREVQIDARVVRFVTVTPNEDDGSERFFYGLIPIVDEETPDGSPEGGDGTSPGA